ncbi:MAG: carbohydrate kinase family protein [Candidatus ainarchaeum sp.]|nr:carbohydrate kinase family protein [Candidatus ainarchaeum sp.]
MPEVVCFGNATIDVFVHLQNEHLHGNRLCLRPDSKIDADRIFFGTGGGATNTAVGLSRLGLKTGIVCALGKDENSKKVLKELEKEKIDCSGIVKLANYNTAYSVILTGFGADRIILSFAGATRHLENEKQVNWKFLEKSEWFCVSSLHSKPGLLKKIFSFAEKKAILVAWNPGKSELRQGFGKLRQLLEKTSILFLNETEAELLTGKKGAKQNLEKLQKIVPLVVITLGAGGSTAFDGKKFFFERARKVRVLDSTGCGDAFKSGFLAAIIRGKGIKQGLYLGSENAAQEIQFLGAKNNLIRKKI